MTSNDNKKKGKLVVYIGRDEGYFETLKARFAKQFAKTEFTYHIISPQKKEDYQKIFLLTVRYRPDIIYIDFSEDRLTQLKLGQLLTRENSLKEVPTVGLVETKANIQECISSGVTFTHVKCGEYYDVVFDPFFWAFPKETTPPSFARAKMHQQVDLINDFRVGYITKNGIHAEGDLPLNVGEKIKLNSSIPKNNIPSPFYIVKEVSQSNLYYDFRYSYELDFIFVDEPEFNVDESSFGEVDEEKREKAKREAQKKENQLKEQYKEEIKRAKKRHKAWLQDRMLDSQPKKTKILVVDPGLKVFESDKLIESYPYTVRTQSFLSENLDEIERIRPHIIAFQYIAHDLFKDRESDIIQAGKKILGASNASALDEEKGEENISLEIREEREKIINEEKEKSRSEILKLVNKIEGVKDYRPFIVVFNSFDFTSESLKENFKYPYMLSNKGHINLSTVTDLAKVFEKRQDTLYHDKIKKKVESLKKSDPHKYRNLKYSDFDEYKFFVKKDDPLSYASYSYPVELEDMTESELTFKIDKEIDHCVFRFNFPVPLTITLINNQDKKFQSDGKLYQYKALIHSVDEDDKKKIRTAINEVFFEPIKKQRQAEEHEYQEVHEKALKARHDEPGGDKKDAENDEEKEVKDFPEQA